MIFETERLLVRKLEIEDDELFFDLKRNINVAKLLPRKTLSKIESDLELKTLINLEQNSTKKIWALTKKENLELMGCCGIMKNESNQDEIGYQLREKFWNFGFGTEIAKALIDFVFYNLKSEIVTADVNLENKSSIKILSKFMTLEKEFFNPEDNCFDRRYILRKVNWK